MRIPTLRRQRGLKFSITPMIDVVFLLIIFFLVASHFVRSETAEAVDLPEARSTEDREERPRSLVVTVTADRRFHVHGEEVDAARVEAMIQAGRADQGPQFEVRLRADRALPYEVVEPLLLACARAGVTNLKFAVLVR